MKKRRIVFFYLLIVFTIPMFAGISFSNIDLNDSDEMLFTVRQNISGTISYNTLFYAKLIKGELNSTPQVITCFPEKMELLSGGTILQIRNRYGVAQYSAMTNTLEWVKKADSIPLDSMRLFPSDVSPDGKWICSINKTGFASGPLIVENTSTGKKAILNKNAPFNYDKVPVKWAEDSSLVLYSKNNKVYFCNPDAILRGIESDENYREIGYGTIDSVFWAGDNLFYIDGDMVYKINVKQLYTTGLYSDIIGKGTPVGRLPERFDSKRDIFSVNKAGTSLLIIKSGKIFSQYAIKGNSSDYLQIVFSKPYVSNIGSLLDAVILWNSLGEPYIWMRLMPYTGEAPQGAVYRVSDSFIPVIAVEDSCRPLLSSDGSRVAFSSGKNIFVYNVSNWKRIGELSGERMISAAWDGNNILYVGSENSVSRWDVISGEKTSLFLSSANTCSWDKSNNKITVTSSDKKSFAIDKDLKTWTQIQTQNNTQITQNGRYRVFVGTTPNSKYENALYIRTLSGKAVTKPIFQESVKKVAQRKKVALAFDAYDNADGLPAILSTLNTYNIKGTFFLNGEFIRRYPTETKQISLTNNNCASLFFSTADLTSNSFIVDENFIRRGLARNEDEFYQCTGKELSLLWHAPYYRATQLIKESGKKAGYDYAEALNGGKGDNTIDDVETLADYLTSTQIIEMHIESLYKAGGGIIPITVGFSRGLRTDYVYQNLDLLVSAILDNGFEIVTADELSN